MQIGALTGLVPAEALTPDQLTQLAAVMLGLVVFAAVFALIERQRGRRGRVEDSEPAPVDDPKPPPPRYVAEPPSVPITTAPPSPDVPEEQPVPFVSRGHEPEPAAPAPAAKPPAVAQTSPADLALPEFAAPDEQAESRPVEPPPPVSLPPASPDEIGIVLPDDPPPR